MLFMMRLLVSGTIDNIAILLAVTLIYTTLRPGEGREPKTLAKICVGVLLGLIGTLLIFQGTSFVPNPLFRVPSVLFLLSGLFFGVVSTVTALSLTSLFSLLYQGGAEVWTGVCGTLVTALVGLLWKELRGIKRGPFSLVELYLAGLTAHLFLFLSLLAFSQEALERVFPLLLLLLGLFPLLTMFLGKLMTDRDLRWAAESKVREGEERFRTLYMDASLGIFHSSLDGRFLDVNPAMARMLGYGSPEEVLAVDLSIPRDLYSNSEDRDKMLKEALEREEILVLDHLYHRKNRDPWNARLHIRLVHTPSGPHLEGFVEDVTEEKRAEKELEEKHILMETLLETIPSPVFYKDVERRYMGCNRAFCDFLGYRREEIVGKRTEEIFEDTESDQFKAKDIELLNNPGVQVYEGFMTNFRGERREILFHKAIFADLHGSALGMVGVMTDITERKQNEEALRQSEQRFREVVSSTPNAICILQNGRVSFVNPSLELLLGYSGEELLGRPFTDLLQEEYREKTLDRIDPEKVGRGEEAAEIAFLCKDGGHAFTDTAFILISYMENPAVLVVSRDITVSKRTAELLKKSEERLRLAMEATSDGLWDWDLVSGEIYWSPRAFEMSGYRPYEFPMNFSVWTSMVHPNDREVIIPEMREKLSRGEAFRVDFRFRMRDGGWRWFMARGKPVAWDGSGKATRMVGTHVDIDETRKTEEKLKTMLAEKELLLKELNHRTKNNMQVIVSMLRLQALQPKCAPLAFVFKEVENKIQAMALVHRRLYQSQDLSKIDLASYIQELTELTLTSLAICQDKVTLLLDMQPVSVTIDVAIPCGLMINELMTNSLKHAFPGERRGTVKVTLSREAGETLALAYEDDGIGVGEGFDFRNQPTLGLQTVLILGEHQLQGRVEFASPPGFHCRLVFRETVYQARV